MPPRLLLDVLQRYGALLRAALWPPRTGCARPTLRHYLAVLPILAGLPVLLAYHWLGFLLDELLFPRYRRVAVRRPLFVLGVPRSSTTAAHRTLAADPRFTTFRTWECLFALSITWRLVLTRLARLDRRIGRPGGRLLARLERRLVAGLAGIHPVAGEAPEEDYLALLPVLGCFILVVPFPDAGYLWRIGHCDRDMPQGERARLLRFHRRCVQRHLYFHGTGRVFLSKNAAFASWTGSLLGEYRDARVVCCLRDPETAVSSQLAAMEPALRQLHGMHRPSVFRDRMIEAVGFSYRNLLECLRPLDARAVIVTARALRTDLANTLISACRAVGVAMPAVAADALRAAAAQSADSSGHRHALADFGLTVAWIRHRFADVYRQVDFQATAPLRRAAELLPRRVRAA